MEVDQSTYLLDLPDEVLEKIVDYLPFVAVRKKLRLTCKRLHSLCNSEHFCQNEVITWPKCNNCRRQMLEIFANSTRRSYNLIFKGVSLRIQTLSEFFEQHGAKVRSLHFRSCNIPTDLLESIIVYCEGLVNLNIEYSSHSFNFSVESNSVTRPTVTSLTLDLNYQLWLETPDIFYRFASTFPCVKHLDVKFDKLCRDKENLLVDLNFVSEFGHLQSLYIDILPQSTSVPQLSSLDELRILFEFNRPNSYRNVDQDEFSALVRKYPWYTFMSRLNCVGISSITMWIMDDIYLHELAPMMHETGLRSLTLHSVFDIHISLEDFKALVSSRLEKMELESDIVAPWARTSQNFPTAVNKTLTDLRVARSGTAGSDKALLIVMFPTYFHGLVHLEVDTVNDAILQSIFKYLKNLRSLVLADCLNCSIAGLFGGEGAQFENSITNLQKLEHLCIREDINCEIIQSQQFQTAFGYLLRLKYLLIKCTSSVGNPSGQQLEIPVNMLKSCVSLEAADIRGFVTPTSAVLSSLFQSLKYLNYLSVNPTCDLNFKDRRTYVNLKDLYWIDSKKLLLDCIPELFHYDQDLDRTVFKDIAGYYTLLKSPRISSYSINWISINLEYL